MAERSVAAPRKLALLAATLAVLIAAAPGARQASAQQAAPGAPTLQDQSRKRYVPQHFDRNGQYVPPHYEAPKKAPFRGHFADKEQARARANQRGYRLPMPDYATPDNGQTRTEGR